MKSIKPGRGPSAMSAAGGVVAVVFGIFWTIMAFTITRNAPFPMIGIIFPLFGLLFIGIGVMNVIYHYKNATGKNRMSLLDITDQDEEPDPLNKYFGDTKTASSQQSKSSSSSSVRKFEGDFCPFCGTKVSDDFDFCPKCGKDI
ncbi:zinc ribbon domain-containing protein [Bacillus sp. HMF5848]|uniref:zinc ribbon domain-containing protein n=1 Tax=Bacillus sp. HMF5848 TaxID=2495421 RepID=UPI000F7821F3|nr:zinc ribbon domain-containing protein [Bacillus sp. HMF5848]RSK26038.1 zinc ribbon domain-containing protein [Bacillus sp. HMF5848]